MTSGLIMLLVVAAAALLSVPALTAVGARRRGSRLPVAIVAGVFFPVTWTVWYVHDEHLYRRSPSSNAT